MEQFIDTVKRELANKPVVDDHDFSVALREIRTWYNHERPHDHLHGRTPAEVWAGIDVFTGQPWTGIGLCSTDGRQDTG